MGLYSAVFTGVLVLGAPFWAWQMLRSRRHRAGLSARLGIVPRNLRDATAGQRVLWLHAVSVGEVLASVPIIRALEQALPGAVVAVSTTTATGQAMARQRLPRSPVFFFPLDLRTIVRRYLRLLRPELLLLVESELWPRLLVECARARIPVAVVNARISDRSLPRYLRLRRLWRPLLGHVSVFLAQSPEDAARLVRIGAPRERVQTTGNLKYDLAPSRSANRLVGLLENLLPASADPASATRVVVAGSTLRGEEEILLDLWPRLTASIAAPLILIVAPRHPQRFEEVAGLVPRAHLRRASELNAAAPALTSGAILLLDTLGDLADVYALGTVAFVGGSLVSAGGHNPLEPARFAVPVLMGPSFENFREIVQTLQSSGGLAVVQNPAELESALFRLLSDPVAAHNLGERAQTVFDQQAGATEKTVRALLYLLARPNPKAAAPR